MPMKTFRLARVARPLLFVLSVFLVSPPADAQAIDPSGTIDAEAQQAILKTVAAALHRDYLYAEKGEALAKEVEAAAKAGRFGSHTTREGFVRAVNAFLLDISNDKHLRLRFGPTEPAGEGGRSGRRVRRRMPDGAGHASPGGSARSEPAHGDTGAGRTETLPDGRVFRWAPGRAPGEFGVAGYEVLDGNVGYLDLRMFAESEEAKPKIDEAMSALEDTDALILDLGRNGGGSPWVVRYLSGFFFDGPTHLTDTWARGMDAPRERWTLPGQPTKAFVGKPVYILTSPRTFSAAESFTFGLVIHDRVTLVGERTGGGGHFGEELPVAPGIRVFLPSGKTYDPATGDGWEAEGIAPDIEVPYDQALERALGSIRQGRAG